ncbi:MAG: Ribosome small subunit-dependent GTPase, partial [Bacillota bacterium]
MIGTIVNLDFGKYLVYYQEQIYSCHIRKTDKLLIKPVVGDHVELDESLSMITMIHPRQTFIKRPRVSNLSDLIIVTSLVEPQYSFFLLAKFI